MLKEIGRHLLVEFSAHFQSDLAAKNISLPDQHVPDDDYFKSLATLLRCPALLPDSFKETLFDLEEMPSPERSNCLKEAVAQAALENIIAEGICHERVAFQLWLARPALLLACQKINPISLELINVNFAGDCGDGFVRMETTDTMTMAAINATPRIMARFTNFRPCAAVLISTVERLTAISHRHSYGFGGGLVLKSPPRFNAASVFKTLMV